MEFLCEDIIPGLPDDLALRCLAKIPHGYHGILETVCKKWRHILRSSEYSLVKSEEGYCGNWLFVSTENGFCSQWIAYDPDANKWHPMPELPGEVFGAIRHGFSCVSISKRFLVIGGYFQSLLSIASKFSAMNDVIKFDPFKKQWSRAASMRTARSNFACAVIGGNVYVVGGCSSSETGCLALAEVYDPLEDRWEDIPPMPTPRWKCIGLSLKGLLYVIDGEDENHLPQCEVEIYDPVKKTWHHAHDSWLHSRPMIPPLFVLGDCILNLNDRHLNYIMIREAEVSKDATNGSWRVVGCVPKVLVHGHDRELVPFKFRVAKLGQEMYVVGGHALKYLQLMRFQIVKLNTVRAFTIGVDKRVEWREVAPMCLSQVSVINCGALEE